VKRKIYCYPQSMVLYCLLGPWIMILLSFFLLFPFHLKLYWYIYIFLWNRNYLDVSMVCNINLSLMSVFHLMQQTLTICCMKFISFFLAKKFISFFITLYHSFDSLQLSLLKKKNRIIFSSNIIVRILVNKQHRMLGSVKLSLIKVKTQIN
jgi:hypothetical protein